MITLVLLAMLGQAADGGGTIAGQVIDTTGRPVSAAVVRIDSAAGTRMLEPDPGLHGRAAILTDADGRFLFARLPPGGFVVTASKGGYADGASGRRRPGGTAQPVDLTIAARSAAAVVIRLWKYGAITGTVTDEAGEPVVGLQVWLLARNRAGPPATPPGAGSGFVAMQRAYSTVGAPVLTDDRGIYRFGNVPDGDYIVVTSSPVVSATRTVLNDAAQTGRGNVALSELVGAGLPAAGPVMAQGAPLQIGDAIVWAGRGRAAVVAAPSGRLRVYPPTFHPAALALAQAATISVSAGAERGAIDIALAPLPAARVTGTLVDRDGPAASVPVRLVPEGAEALPANLIASTSLTDAAGTFVFAAVPAGQYRLHAASLGWNWVDTPVVVGGDDVDGLIVTPSPLPGITVRLQFDSSAPPPSGPDGRGPLPMPGFVLDAVDGAVGSGQLMTQSLSDDRGYSVHGYVPGRYRLRMVNSPTGWMFKAAMLNGVDVSETPFDLAKDVSLTLVFTDRWTGLSGLVHGTGADAATVLAFPADGSQWSGDRLAPRRFKTARANARGQFGMSSLPPGEYFVVAIPDEQADDWRNPATLDSLARLASSITILDGEHKVLDLQVREARQ